MLQSIFGANPLLWVIRQQLLNKIYCVFADGLPLFLVNLVLALLHSFNYLIVICAVEWWIATQQDIQYDAHGP